MDQASTGNQPWLDVCPVSPVNQWYTPWRRLTYETDGVVHCAYHFSSKDALSGVVVRGSSGLPPALYDFHEEFLAGYAVSPEGRSRSIATEAELEVCGMCGGGVEACVDVVLGGVGEDGGGVRDRAGVLDRGVWLLREVVEGGRGVRGGHRGGVTM